MSNKENAAPVGPPISPFATSPRRPSEFWLKNPAWIDGAIDPPHFYGSHEEIEAALHAAGVSSNAYVDQQAALSTPTPNHYANIKSHAQALGEGRDIVNPTSSTSPGHLISVGMVYSLAAAPGPGGRASKGLVKQKPTMKMTKLVLDKITCADFIKAFLATHNMSDKYSPGVHSGPDFKLWWSGSLGAKSGAATIQTDKDFYVALEHLLSKPKGKCTVSVEFDLDNMMGFRIQQPLPLAAVNPNTKTADGELVYGTKVPQLGGFSEVTQLHGSIIMELKATWPCSTHLNEHGGAGFCYVSNTSEHVLLNARRLKAWAATIVFVMDVYLDLGLEAMQGQGYLPPLLVISNLAPMSLPLSPIPTANSELRSCLSDFAEAKGIDLTACEEALTALDLTPDIIPDVPVQRLCDITHATEGQILKLHVFCRGWNARLEEKKEKRRRIDL
ncbi:uncharacterized protein LACBIDRAFT_332644 [Laccaria bicolor S238N-H82]|uniref:Predicted protein n=1 Tax=Laccaria bicolor (strain S238N-H82 / ATCC MYA-4686) TaxID=486041 RepID=B0DTF0_LACBS|nr:uncharacterized protein LACBIDRAFT_332644 [Laccaria bicolor S238N-H82]EDR02051.1 predicted protein [Laccaria bicolor S238N-H82]|eukprot:XP_001887208.1 predicted protein [Laccaria bicolor S238N-H82]